MKRENFLYIGIFVCMAWALLLGWLSLGRGNEDTTTLLALGCIVIMIPAVILYRYAGK